MSCERSQEREREKDGGREGMGERGGEREGGGREEREREGFVVNQHLLRSNSFKNSGCLRSSERSDS